MQIEMEAGSWRGKAKTDEAGRVIPNVLAQYKEDAMRTTGLSLPAKQASCYRQIPFLTTDSLVLMLLSLQAPRHQALS